MGEHVLDEVVEHGQHVGVGHAHRDGVVGAHYCGGAVLGGGHDLPETHALVDHVGQVGAGGAVDVGAADVFYEGGDLALHVHDVGDERCPVVGVPGGFGL